MKKTLLTILVCGLCLCLFAGCKTQTPNDVTNPEVENTENKENENIENVEDDFKIILPLPETIDINALDNCTVAVSLEKGDAYVNDEGKMMMDLTVYTYALYDMVDIATLAENDIIVRKGEEVTVKEIERLDTGLININGGEENGGFSLISSDSTVYYEIGMSDVKAYYAIGEVSIPVSTEFIYTDASDLDAEAIEYYPGDFLLEEEIFDYNFNPNNTSVVVENGKIVAMKKVYTP